MRLTRSTAARVGALAATAAVAAATVLVAPTSAGAVAGCTGGLNWVGDLDGDDVPDTVVGVPNADGNKGVVDVRLSDSADRRITSEIAGVARQPGDQFGRSVTSRDLNADGCDDLVIGVPGAAGGGYVLLVLSGSDGPTGGGAVRIDNPGKAGDQFGTAVAVTSTWHARWTGLWVGAPGADVSGKTDSGALYHFLVQEVAEAPDTFTVKQLKRFSTNGIGLGNGVQAGERLGEVVESEGSQVVAGIPRRDVDGKKDAGAVALITASNEDDSSADYDAKLVTQDSKGVADEVEAGDRFGAAVSMHGTRVAIGVPGEDVGRKKAGRDVGAVQVYPWWGGKAPLITQDGKAFGKKVPGESSRGDRFGSAVAWLHGNGCRSGAALAVGVPGDDVTVKKAKKARKKARKARRVQRVDAGSVVVLDTDRCRHKRLVEGRTLPGKVQNGDRLGSALAAVRDNLNGAERKDALLIGVPGQDVGGKRDAGAVAGYARGTLTGGPVAGLRYGSVLGTAVR